jgi:hypothetical protein
MRPGEYDLLRWSILKQVATKILMMVDGTIQQAWEWVFQAFSIDKEHCQEEWRRDIYMSQYGMGW